MENKLDILKKSLSLNKPISLIGVAIGIFALSILFIDIRKISQENRNSEYRSSNPSATEKRYIADSAIIYGSWDGSSSKIYAYDLSTSIEYLLTSLPDNIKKLSVLPDSRLLFINKTDIKDHGSEIVIYNLTTKTSSTLYTADHGFGIDNYVLSPNKEYMAVWEVQMEPESGVLLGGKSRIYTIKLGEQKNQIYNEMSSLTSPIHYPILILNDGTVFMDRLIPNTGSGWAYGMTMSDFLGRNITPVDSMKAGTYGTQPLSSPDGKYIVFSGYDQNKGNGEQIVEGHRRALLSANTVELLDTKSLERKKITNLPNTNLYDGFQWDLFNPYIVYFSVNSRNASMIGRWRYDDTSESLHADQLSPQEHDIIAFLTNSLSLTGTIDTSDSATANLGKSYSVSYTNLHLYNPENAEIQDLSVNPSIIQIIDIVPYSYINLDTLNKMNLIKRTESKSDDNLQLKSFTLKPELYKKREDQQHNPPIKSSSRQNNNGGNKETNGPPPPDPNEIGCQPFVLKKCQELYPEGFTVECRSYWSNELKRQGVCNSSPLYLYGEPGKSVSVTIHTEIFNSNIGNINSFVAKLTTNNQISVNKYLVNSISFDYTPVISRILPPKSGFVTSRSNLRNTVHGLAKKLNLNHQETEDLLKYVNSVIYGKYAFISLYDHETSHAILPITFDPKPDVYRNIIFYFKNLEEKPNYSIQPPVIKPIQRHGFTAIEISGMVE